MPEFKSFRKEILTTGIPQTDNAVSISAFAGKYSLGCRDGKGQNMTFPFSFLLEVWEMFLLRNIVMKWTPSSDSPLEIGIRKKKDDELKQAGTITFSTDDKKYLSVGIDSNFGLYKAPIYPPRPGFFSKDSKLDLRKCSLAAWFANVLNYGDIITALNNNDEEKDRIWANVWRATDTNNDQANIAISAFGGRLRISVFDKGTDKKFPEVTGDLDIGAFAFAADPHKDWLSDLLSEDGNDRFGADIYSYDFEQKKTIETGRLTFALSGEWPSVIIKLKDSDRTYSAFIKPDFLMAETVLPEETRNREVFRAFAECVVHLGGAVMALTNCNTKKKKEKEPPKESSGKYNF